ncbi:MAG TPA: bifunctional hydroxymethylpyrimidine kinase/phosphomethylpyrimidine kinase, partial [Chthoniobacterales bacterium]
MMSASIPVALTIAGSDSSAGAGIQADLKTFGALGVYGVTAVTCVVAETPGRVAKIEPMSADLVREQIEVLLRSFPVAAIKTGLLCSGEIVAAIADALREDRSAPLVVDPVMIATSGDQLLRDDAIEIYERELFPIATVITPNLNEAARLAGKAIVDVVAMRKAGAILTQKYRVPVLLKGGHLAGNQAIDLLFADGNVTEFSAPFSRGVATHGTGCTYSAAIAAGLGTGLP